MPGFSLTWWFAYITSMPPCDGPKGLNSEFYGPPAALNMFYLSVSISLTQMVPLPHTYPVWAESHINP